MVKSSLLVISILLILGACASRMRDQMKDYRTAFVAQEYEKASALLDKSDLKDDKKSLLLWHMEKGSLALASADEDSAVTHFEAAVDLIDRLYTTKLSAKAASLFINDASDEFYGASYERSYCFYYLSKSYYARYLKKGVKLDLQSARAAILAWDTYFIELQRSATTKTLYQTDLMLKVFGGEIHEISDVKNDDQIALQLYKDALKILETQGGIFSIFNKKSVEYIRDYEERVGEGKAPTTKFYEATPAQKDLKDFLHFKILTLTKEIRGGDFDNQVKTLKPDPEVVKEAKKGGANVVLVLEEGFIPQKVGKNFNFGIKGAMNAVDNKSAKSFIAGAGVEAVTLFAMNKLGMGPTQTASAGSFVFAHSATKLAVTEAAIEFELPMIEEVPLTKRLELFILDDKGVIVRKGPLPVVTENGEIAKVVLEEDVVSRYTKTGTRVALKHILAIVAAMKVYQSLKQGNDGDFLAKTAAMATYVGASKGIAAMEKADTRHWTTLPDTIRMTEMKLPPGTYQLAIATYTGEEAPKAPVKNLGSIQVKNSDKSIHHLKFQSL